MCTRLYKVYMVSEVGDVWWVVALCELCAARHATLTALVTNRKVRFNLFNYSNLLICFI